MNVTHAFFPTGLAIGRLISQGYDAALLKEIFFKKHPELIALCERKDLYRSLLSHKEEKNNKVKAQQFETAKEHRESEKKALYALYTFLTDKDRLTEQYVFGILTIDWNDWSNFYLFLKLLFEEITVPAQ